ncbi:hypothetical protein FFLO_05819 [Filobasidium floriforme]|uniref:Guanine deaminase n=1 Tax=Filobasidium floriforme TaxID=5210 RepID=A0A8K0JIE4_9TREE|nr:hypothetical protein FFLO_05819 [Filobasidium floriforme]
MHASTTLYHGPIVHSLSLDELEYAVDALVCVSPDGIINWIERNVDTSEIQDRAASHGLILDGTNNAVEIVQLGGHEFLCPGLIDTHTHAPQYPNLGLGQEYQLLDWLSNVTFPREAMFSDSTYATAVYEEVVKRTLAVGVTTASYYASLHESASKILAETTLRAGQRALIGKCNMDRNCPPEYREPSAKDSIEATRALISHVRAICPAGGPTAPLVQPCVTPRFALSCTSELMASLGELVAEDPSLHLQTHLSENTAEIKETLDLFPDCESYTAVYDKYGMLRKGTILAHCVWLSPAEMTVISDRHAGISHCPTSNFNLMSGGARVGAMLDEGIEVGLGSDCGGGFAIGILSQIRDASKLSKMIALNASTSEPSKKRKYSDKPLSIPALFHMATLGGASICNLKDRIGNFEAGKEFDALRVTPGASPGFFLDVGEDTTATSGSKSRQERVEVLKRNFERFLFVSDDRDIADVWVQGRRVAGSRS